MDKRARQIEELLNQALGLPAGDRERYIRDRCPDDSILDEILSLISTPTNQPSPLQSAGVRRALNVTDAGRVDDVGTDTFMPEVRVLGTLGQGGMGVVHIVHDPRTKQIFALKRQRFKSDKHRALFLAEIKFWLDLPHHPNFTRCIRRSKKRNLIWVLSEFVDGVSLASRIGTPAFATLEGILDAAIQMAWSLHVLHTLGHIHRDVKPSNFLITDQGHVILTDFGLAAGRVAAGLETAGERGTSIVVSCGGMTIAYRSPEQAALRLLTPRTDIWSWATSVLEMFCGCLDWTDGADADAALQRYLQQGPSNVTAVRMPDEMAELLRQCLRRSEHERPRGMESVAIVLKTIYHEHTGTPYPRTLEPPPIRKPDRMQRHLGNRARDLVSRWLGEVRAAIGLD